MHTSSGTIGPNTVKPVLHSEQLVCFIHFVLLWNHHTAILKFSSWPLSRWTSLPIGGKLSGITQTHGECFYFDQVCADCNSQWWPGKEAEEAPMWVKHGDRQAGNRGTVSEAARWGQGRQGFGRSQLNQQPPPLARTCSPCSSLIPQTCSLPLCPFLTVCLFALSPIGVSASAGPGGWPERERCAEQSGDEDDASSSTVTTTHICV